METSKRYAHSQILWMTRNPLLCLTHFILFASIIELLLFISTNGSVCWPAPRIFGKAPSILQITYISSQRGWGVRPMVASVVLKISAAQVRKVEWLGLHRILSLPCCKMSAVVILRQIISRKGQRGFGRRKTDDWIGFASRLICQRNCWHLRGH